MDEFEISALFLVRTSIRAQVELAHLGIAFTFGDAFGRFAIELLCFRCPTALIGDLSIMTVCSSGP